MAKGPYAACYKVWITRVGKLLPSEVMRIVDQTRRDPRRRRCRRRWTEYWPMNAHCTTRTDTVLREAKGNKWNAGSPLVPIVYRRFMWLFFLFSLQLSLSHQTPRARSVFVDFFLLVCIFFSNRNHRIYALRLFIPCPTTHSRSPQSHHTALVRQ